MKLHPSKWVTKHRPLITQRGHVLDLACGQGRHTRYLLGQGFRVTSVDRDISGMYDLQGDVNCTLIEADLEMGEPWAFDTQFDAVVVTNYLHRPGFREIASHCKPGGVLLYQTFMVGNEAYGKPTNPDFLLEENELIRAFSEQFETLAFEQGYSGTPKPAVVQSYCGRRRTQPGPTF